MKRIFIYLFIFISHTIIFAQNDYNYIQINLSQKGGIAYADLIIEDGIGRKTGYDILSNRRYDEIPNAQYGDEGIGKEITKIFSLEHAADGNYLIMIIGSKKDSYDLIIHTSRGSQGNVDGKRVTFSETTSYGKITEYRLRYNTDTNKLIIVEKILSVPSQYPTIQAAVNVAQTGDVIEVNPGVYNELVAVNGKDSLFVRTMGAAGGSTVKGFKLSQSHKILIKGFVVDATGTTEHGIVLMGGNNQNTDVTLESNEIKNAGNDQSGISIARGNPRTRIVNNRIHDNGRNGIMIIDATGGPHYVINNTIVKNGWNGVSAARQHVIDLVNNILSFNGTKTGTTGGRYGVDREAMTGPGEAAGITLINNMIVGNNGKVTATSSKNIGNYSQTLDGTDRNNWTTAGNEGAGVISSPSSAFSDIFTSESPLNMRLKAGSIAGDKGAASYNPPDQKSGAIPSEDFEGDNRPVGTSVDLGADEMK